MKSQRLCCKTKRKFKHTTDSNHDLPVAPNLLQRDFSPAAPNQAYIGNITHIPTKAGWLYLAVVINLFSRQVVDWSMNRQMKASLVNDALAMAIDQRKPAEGLLSPSDRGGQTKIFYYIGVYYNRLRMHSANDYLASVEFEQLLKAA